MAPAQEQEPEDLGASDSEGALCMGKSLMNTFLDSEEARTWRHMNDLHTEVAFAYHFPAFTSAILMGRNVAYAWLAAHKRQETYLLHEEGHRSRRSHLVSGGGAAYACSNSTLVLDLAKLLHCADDNPQGTCQERNLNYKTRAERVCRSHTAAMVDRAIETFHELMEHFETYAHAKDIPIFDVAQ